MGPSRLYVDPTRIHEEKRWKKNKKMIFPLLFLVFQAKHPPFFRARREEFVAPGRAPETQLWPISFHIFMFFFICSPPTSMNKVWKSILFLLSFNRPWNHSKSLDLAICYPVASGRAPETQIWPTWWKNKLAIFRLFVYFEATHENRPVCSRNHQRKNERRYFPLF